MPKPYNMPKLESPFERREISGEYICIPKIKDEYRWIFTDEAIAVEKFHGTNVSVWIENGKIKAILNRKNPINIWKKGNSHFVQGITNAIDKGYFVPDVLEDGGYFGELIGTKLMKDPYGVKGHLWLPFDYLLESYRFKFWDGFIEEVNGRFGLHTRRSDEEVYNATRDVFRGLWSLYKRKRGIKGDVTEDVGFDGLAAEGIVFYRKGKEREYSSCCKLRRDMFDFYVGRRH